jgi:hypothetical protein
MWRSHLAHNLMTSSPAPFEADLARVGFFYAPHFDEPFGTVRLGAGR